MPPMVLGMFPVKLFPDRSNASKTFISPTSSGREPLIELDDKFKAKRSLRPQRVEGICGVNLLESRNRPMVCTTCSYSC